MGDIDIYGWTPLHVACYYGNLDEVISILNKTRNKVTTINAIDNCGCTSLHRAVQSGSHLLVNMLIDKGADANIQNNNDNSPLHWALQWGYVKIIDILIKYTNLSLENREGRIISNIIENDKFIKYKKVDDLFI